MKNTNILWLIAVITIIGIVALSCDEPTPTPPAITTASLPDGMVGVAYSQTLAATGDTPITWSIDSGDLPTGLTLAEATGVISGTPTGIGTSTFTVKATNDAGNDTKELSIEVINPPTYTVTFETGTGGSTVAAIADVTHGTTISAPTPPTRPFTLTEPGLYSGPIPANYTFVEWRNGATAWNFASSTVTGNITLTAQWTASANRIETVAANNVSAAVTRVNLSGAANEGSYTLVINQDVTLSANQWLNVANRHLTIIGLGQERTITAPAEGAFIVNSTNHPSTPSSLTLEENITIKGTSGNSTDNPIQIRGGASLTMKAGSKITGYTADTGEHYPVNLNNNSTFIMDGGEISGNSRTFTGSVIGSAGVYVSTGCTFTMNDGLIINNTFINAGSATGNNRGGGGVALRAQSGISFIMNGGEITGNTRNGEPSDVFIPTTEGVTFTYTTGTIGALFDKSTDPVAKP